MSTVKPIPTITVSDPIDSDWIRFTPGYGREVALSQQSGQTTKGGPGSGFHGHAGRPGKVGGSAGGKKLTFPEYVDQKIDHIFNDPIIAEAKAAGFPVYRDYADIPEPTGDTLRLYHGTMSRNLASIAEHGLLSQREQVRRGISKFPEESATQWVLLTPTKQGTAEDVRFHGDSIVIADVPKSMVEGQTGREVGLKEIPRKFIKGVYIPFHGMPKEGFSASALGLPAGQWNEAMTLLEGWHKEYDERFKGGPGSGNFAHAGRPGKIGGSAAGQAMDGEVTPEKLESAFESLYPDKASPGEEYQYSWLSPSGKLLALREDHQASARDIMHSLTGQTYRPDQVYDLVEDLVGKYGFVRVSIQPDSYVNFSSPIKPTVKQISVIRKLHKQGLEDAEFVMDFPQSGHDPVWNWEDFTKMVVNAYKGGKGSGNFAHAGRPGHVGGSAPQSGEGSPSFDPTLPSDYHALIERFAPNHGLSGMINDPAEYKRLYKLVDAHVFPYLDRVGIRVTRHQLEKPFSDALNQVWAEKGDHYIGPETEILLAIEREMRHEHDFRVRQAVCLGEIEPEEADEYSYEAAHPNGVWRLLPAETFHATVNSAAVKAQGLKSRRERGSSGGEGLGGGEDEVVCLTDRADYAKTIERGLHEMSLCARGTLNVRKMVDLAQSGAGGVGHDWSGRLQSFIKTIEGKDDLQEFIDIDEGHGIKHDTWHILGDKEPDRPYTQEEIMEKRFSILKSFMAARGAEGGFTNPMFMFNDWKATAALDPAQFKVHVYAPANPKVKGAYLGPAEGEYRIVGGKAVKFKRAIDFFKPDDLKAIFGEL